MSVDYTANNLGTSNSLNVNPTLQASGLQTGSLNTNNNPSFKLNSSSSAAASNNNTDILWRNSNTGENVEWWMNGTALSSNLNITSVPDQNWKIVGTGDFNFNKDGNTDILWRNSKTGQDVVWFMNGSNLVSWQELKNAPIPTLDWNLFGNQQHHIHHFFIGNSLVTGVKNNCRLG